MHLNLSIMRFLYLHSTHPRIACLSTTPNSKFRHIFSSRLFRAKKFGLYIIKRVQFFTNLKVWTLTSKVWSFRVKFSYWTFQQIYLSTINFKIGFTSVISCCWLWKYSHYSIFEAMQKCSSKMLCNILALLSRYLIKIFSLCIVQSDEDS